MENLFLPALEKEDEEIAEAETLTLLTLLLRVKHLDESENAVLHTTILPAVWLDSGRRNSLLKGKEKPRLE